MPTDPLNPDAILPGTIIVNSVPEGVPVKLDGTDTGKVTPVTLEKVPAGCHVVMVTLPDDCRLTREVKVSPGTAVSVCLKRYTEEEERSIRKVGLYTAGFIIVLSTIAIINRLFLSPLIDDLTQIMIYIACSGGFGALAYSLYGFIKHLEKNNFSVNFARSYYYRPFLGIVFGSFAFLFVAGGLMTLSNVQPDSNLFTTKNVMFYCALAFLAGFAEKAFSVQLKEISEAVFKTGDTSK